MILDILIQINLHISLLMFFLICKNMKGKYSLLPKIFFLITFFQLSLNVSSTLLILIKGAGFGGYLIGVVATTESGGIIVLLEMSFIFLGILVPIISKNLFFFTETARVVRISIDAEYSSIPEKESLKQTNALQRKSDFYASMGSVGKFILGNMKVGIVIILVNIIGGIIIGTTLRGEPMTEAVNTYIALAIGVGLMFQFPSLLVYTSAAIFVARANYEIDECKKEDEHAE